MRYNPATDRAVLSLEEISAQCHAAVDAIPVERRTVFASVWDGTVGRYVNQHVSLPVGCPFIPATV